MIEWLMLVVIADGHLNAQVRELHLERQPTEQACKVRGKELAAKEYRLPFACVPVAALPKGETP